MSDEIEWGAPPPSKNAAPGSVLAFVVALRARPGEWARYPRPQKSASAASNFKVKGPDIEWATRARPDGKYDIYGRAKPATDNEGESNA